MLRNRLVFTGLGIVLGTLLGWAAGRLAPPSLAARTSDDTAPTAKAAPPPGSDAALAAQLDAQYERFRLIDDSFALVARAVSPSIVHIVARKDGRRSDGTPTRLEETGSGVIVKADADDGQGRYVLTNNHVVAGAVPEQVAIKLHDGRLVNPDRIWLDPKLDVAVMRLANSDLPAARLGNSDMAPVGSWVLAMGSPFGLTHSVSQGIISARSRYEPQLEQDGVENQDFLQTDAAINPGNSGGPLVNMRGEVVGINTAIASNGGGNEGVGFSIPSNLVRWALNQLVRDGHVLRGAIGVTLQDLSARRALELGLERPRGAHVDWVQPGTPAEQAGLKRGDVILRFNAVDILDYNHLITMVSTTPIGKAVELLVWRQGKSLAVSVLVADREQIRAGQPRDPQRGPEGLMRRPGADEGLMRGLQLAAVDTSESARQFGWSDSSRGVAVAAIDADAALAAVLQRADLLEAVDGKPVKSPDDVRAALAAPGDHAIHFQRIENEVARNRIVQIEAPH